MACKDANFNILLTAFNEDQRQEMTRDVIEYYTNTLHFPKNQIFIVDSSNNGVGDVLPLENQITFDQNKVCDPNEPDFDIRKTNFEACSLQRALDHSSTHRLFSKPYIVKMTAKYKLPELCSSMNEAQSESPNVIVQSRHDGDEWQNTELWGASSGKFAELVSALNSTHDETTLMEKRFAKFCKQDTCRRLPSLRNEATYKRGVGDFLDSL